MRLFIAVPLPPELADRAAALLPLALPALKRVRPELMHITLAFLGWTSDEQLPTVIEAAMARKTDDTPPLQEGYSFPAIPLRMVEASGSQEGREWLERFREERAAGKTDATLGILG